MMDDSLSPLRPGQERKRSELKSRDINGYVFPMFNDLQPVTLSLPSNESVFLPIYSTVEKLRESMTFAQVTGYNINQIDDALEFLDSIAPSGMRVIADPYIHKGNTRWTEIMLPESYNR